MPRRLAVLLVCVVLLAGSSLSAAAAELAAPLARLELADGDTLVFLGDSITHQCLYTQYVEDYFYTRFPRARIRFHNSGVGGDRCSDALVRFQRDVAHYQPKYVTILLGMNDGSYQPYNDAIFQTYRQDMTKLLGQIQQIGARAVLITPTMFDARARRLRNPNAPAENTELYNATLAYFGAWLREQAVERGLGFVDMYGPLNNLTLEARKTDPKFTLIADAVHPDAPGQLVMAFAVLMDLGVPRPLSSITITRGADNQAAAKATGGKVSDARFTSDGLEFTFAAEGLPLALPEAAALGAKLTHLGHRLSREALEVHGLSAGKYQLLIDGQPVGQYDAAALERHIELQDNAQTPQHQQALAVAQLNQQRNDEAMRPLRNLWRDKKLHVRAQAQAAANPNDEQARQNLAALDKKLADFESQVAALDARCREFEDRIYQANQPAVRKYQLVRLAK